MVARFVEQATHKRYNRRKLTELVIQTCHILQTAYSHLTPRALDRLIWDYQQKQT